MQKLIEHIKNNWKNAVFVVIYIIMWTIITTLVISTESGTSNLIILFLAAIFSTCLVSVIGKFVVQGLFKENAEKVVKNAGLILFSAGIITAIFVVIGLFSFMPGLPGDRGIGDAVAIFLIPALFGVILIIGVFIVTLSLIVFSSLRLAIKNIKVMIILTIIAGCLWLGSSYISRNINIMQTIAGKIEENEKRQSE